MEKNEELKTDLGLGPRKRNTLRKGEEVLLVKEIILWLSPQYHSTVVDISDSFSSFKT